MVDQQDYSIRAVSVAAAGLLNSGVEQVALLGGEWNRTYRIDLLDGQRYIGKIVPDTEAERAQLHWQHALLDRCAKQSDLPAPRVTQNEAGFDSVPVQLGNERWLLSCYLWLPGQILAEIPTHTPELLAGWGRLAGRLVVAMEGMAPGQDVRSTHEWDLLGAPHAIASHLSALESADERRYVETAMDWFDEYVSPHVDSLPRAVIHQDLNDHNVLAEIDSSGAQRITGVIDFTDALLTARVSEIAIAGGYAMLRKEDPATVLATVVAGFDEIVELSDLELSVLYPMAVLRLALNGVTWKSRNDASPGGYGEQRSQHTWTTLAQLVSIHPTEVNRILLSHRDQSACPSRASSKEL
ncbi:phosphotransferase [Rhodococcus globerulus]|uniref:Hydroxylysine kinase n=1 Tax=Rhodococcus globerulus TaxID=33008 RepID=A0ABU4C2S7_RHOGO|nr:phosphotransferase [Rhodococcus globerulus]MDV6270805.1 phosphotransferase [Rhodococcus globerulus]